MQGLLDGGWTHVVDVDIKSFFDTIDHERLMRLIGERIADGKLLDSLRSVTRRCNGYGLDEIIRRVNVRLRGWFEYFRHACRSTFVEIDGWVRMRLRSILRKRRKRKGGARGADHQRWPNAFFTERGLFSCDAACAELANP